MKINTKQKNILVTGGSGYVGSHVSKYLYEAGYNPIVYDRVADARPWANPYWVAYQGDIADTQNLKNLFDSFNFHAVMHLAASSEVGPSVSAPLDYYENNVSNTIGLIRVCNEFSVKRIIFSSTSAVYGQVEPAFLPTEEWYHKRPITSYGASKLCIEHMLSNCEVAHGIKSVSLRYFNASGAAPDACIGEVRENATHLIPCIFEVVHGLRPFFQINGNDYETADGTAVRDYTHVWDIASAHVAALEYLGSGRKTSLALNIGSGVGTSVQEVFNTVCKEVGRDIPYTIAPRRPGDIPTNYARCYQALKHLKWQAKMSDITTIVKHAHAWYSSQKYNQIVSNLKNLSQLSQSKY